jgi:hypothetical protein
MHHHHRRPLVLMGIKIVIVVGLVANNRKIETFIVLFSVLFSFFFLFPCKFSTIFMLFFAYFHIHFYFYLFPSRIDIYVRSTTVLFAMAPSYYTPMPRPLVLRSLSSPGRPTEVPMMSCRRSICAATSTTLGPLLRWLSWVPRELWRLSLRVITLRRRLLTTWIVSLTPWLPPSEALSTM